MVVWLRPQCILAIVTSLYYCSQLVSSKTYDKFWCATEEGHHPLYCPDENALLTDVSIRKVYRRTEMCAPDVHSDYLVHCQDFLDGSSCEGNRTCSIEVSSRSYIECRGKTYAPTYFYVKYTCSQIHTMCTDIGPIRNTLYGFIVSPGYPHPMADNLKCSINIEADPSMYIELTPIQVRLQDTNKCRSEYLEVFGYINGLNGNSSSNSVSNKDSKEIWKSYHLWCGPERSTNGPSPHSRYLISSNLLYMSLHTGASRKPRFFKIRYKVIPSIARSQYDSNGTAYGSISDTAAGSGGIMTTSIPSMSTTIVVPALEEQNMKNLNGTATRRTFKKEIIIGIIAGVVLLVIAILVGVGVFLFIKKRRSNPPSSKSTPSATPVNPGKKNISSPASTNNTVLKSGLKSPDKAPLLDQPTTTAPPAIKRKLIPERTVQISDVNTSRFKSALGTTPASTTAPAAAPAGNTSGPTSTTTTTTTTAVGKEVTSTSSDPSAIPPATLTSKPVFTAADSGIYGADLSDEVPPVTKIISSVDVPKIYGVDLPDKSNQTSLPSLSSPPPPSPLSASTSAPPVIVVVNPLSETSASTSTKPENTTLSAIVVPNNVPMNPLPKEETEEEEEEDERIPLPPLNRFEHLDETVKSAYSNLIDATMSENEGTVASSSVVSSASQSRRTSNAKQPLISHESNNTTTANIDTIPRKTTPFNPLHVILKKDANKYYTTEYI